MHAEESPVRPRRPDDGTLRVRRVVLEDANGRPTATLGATPDGHGVVLLDPEEHPRVQVVVDDGGAAHLKLHQRSGEVGVWLRVGANGAPHVWLRDVGPGHRVRGHAELQIDAHGCPSLSLHDGDGCARALLRVDEVDGRPTLALSDARGETRVVLSEDDDRRSAAARPPAAAARASAPSLPVPAVGAAEPIREVPGCTVSLAPQADEVVAAGAPDAAGPTPDVPPAVAALATDPTVSDGTADSPTTSATESDVTALALRVTRLEQRRVGRRRLATAALVLFAAGFGGFAGRLLDPTMPFALDSRVRLATPEPGAHVLEAQEFVLRASTGDVRGRLGLLADGTPYLQLLGPDGQSEAQLSALPGREAQLRLATADASAVLGAGPDGIPAIGLWKGDGAVFQAPPNVARFPPPRGWD